MFTEVLDFIRGLPVLTHEVLYSVIDSTRHRIIDLNVAQLADFGKDSKNKALPTPYSAVTIEIKRVLGQRTDIITLRDTGDWHSAFYISLFPDYFEINSGDWKTNKLIKEWGEDIFGLTDESLSTYKNEITEILIDEIKKRL